MTLVIDVSFLLIDYLSMTKNVAVEHVTSSDSLMIKA